METKDKGNIKGFIKLKADITLMNGEEASRFFRVPCYFINYDEPEEAKEYTKQQHNKFWFKLEDAEFKRIEKQMNKNLKEISIWFDDENNQKLKDFLKKEEED